MVFRLLDDENQGKTSYQCPHVKLHDLVVEVHGHCVLKVLDCISILYTTMSSDHAVRRLKEGSILPEER